jgi:hypothetical protein
MAIYHNSSKIISRSKGRSAVGASAYRSGEKIYNEYDDLQHDYSKKSGIAHSEIMIPEHAKEEFKNRATLWNKVEKIENAKNSQLAREVEVALPREFNRQEQIQLVREYVKDNFVKNGMCADINIHDKGDGNPHSHIMLTMRPIKENGEWGAKAKKEYILDEKGQKIKLKSGQYKSKKIETTNWNTKEFLQSYREDWANKINEKLKEKGINERVDHRSYEEQGIEKLPTKHEGFVARAMEKRAIKKGTEKSDRVAINREIKKDNQQIELIKNKQAEIVKERKGIKQDNWFTNLHENTDSLRKVIPKATEKELVLIKENIKKLDGAVKEHTKINYNENRVYSVEGKQVPYIKYHLNKYEHEREYLVKAIENNLKENKHLIEADKREETSITSVDNKSLNNAQRIGKELESKRKEYIKVYKQLEENKKPNMRPQVNSIYKIQIEQIRRYEDNVNRCNQSISTNQKEKEGLGILKFKEKKELDNNIKRLENLRAENLENLRQLGVNDLSKVNEVVKEKQSKVLAENQKIKEFDNKNKELENLKVQLKREYKEIENKIPTELREEVKNILDQERNSSKDYVEKEADIELYSKSIYDTNSKELTQNKSKNKNSRPER